jgi:hypothetical protein
VSDDDLDPRAMRVLTWALVGGTVALVAIGVTAVAALVWRWVA